MDTKSNSIKPALAFLSFVLGGSLLLYSVAAAIVLFWRGGVPWQDVLWTDYQNTSTFRRFMGERLYELLDNAVLPEEKRSQPDMDGTGLLYTVRRNGQVLYSNAGSLALGGALPKGYNLLLYFDGAHVAIEKDGREVDVYGDGHYRGVEQGDWYVPGYQEFFPPYEDSYSDLTVYLAAEARPAGGSNANNSLYRLYGELTFTRTLAIWLVIVPPLAGIVLLALSAAWHRHKVRADQAIAWFTGRLWLELKLLLLLPFLMLCFLAAHRCLAVLTGTFSAYPVLSYLAVPAALWWFYLYVNDLRYNFGRIRERSLCAAGLRLLRRQEFRLPVAQRFERRAMWQFAACIPFFLFCILSVPYLHQQWFWSGLGPIALALVCTAGAALIALQLWLMRENRRFAAELDKLLHRIEAAGAGRLESTPPLPAESDFHDASEQLVHMEEGLRTALNEQMKSERMKVELIANVSHDLKTPLTSIISYTELLRQEEELPGHVQDYIHILSDKSRRLQSMVQDVFEVSKAATGNLPVAIQPIDFAKLLRQTLADMDEAVEASGLTLKLRLPEEPVWIAADGDRLYRVFQNLIGNALRYSLDGSRVHLILDAADGQATAVLRNTSRDELPEGLDLTERFVRGDSSRTNGGSGLGLSIARAFTEACGGQFSIQIQADLFTASVAFPLTQARPQTSQG